MFNLYSYLQWFLPIILLPPHKSFFFGFMRFVLPVIVFWVLDDSFESLSTFISFSVSGFELFLFVSIYSVINILEKVL